MHPKHWLKLCSGSGRELRQLRRLRDLPRNGHDGVQLPPCPTSSSTPASRSSSQAPRSRSTFDVTDARTNLLDSLRFAASDRAHGVTIVFDGKVIAGTRGKKERSKSYNAFSSINFPYLAVIQDEHILYYIDDKWQDRESVRFYHEMDSQVSLLKLIPSMDSSLLDYMAEHYDAVVIESFRCRRTSVL